ncbi:hypothetical protein V5O48_011232 [Marasmius crinis-equi]|uniref:Uncharacterized protein n=1 Tax=Marasmius crinis-equi TaxID=585013 RepID=A0ABR3F6H3_9AGAR
MTRSTKRSAYVVDFLSRNLYLLTRIPTRIQSPSRSESRRGRPPPGDENASAPTSRPPSPSKPESRANATPPVQESALKTSSLAQSLPERPLTVEVPVAAVPFTRVAVSLQPSVCQPDIGIDLQPFYANYPPDGFHLQFLLPPQSTSVTQNAVYGGREAYLLISLQHLYRLQSSLAENLIAESPSTSSHPSVRSEKNKAEERGAFDSEDEEQRVLFTECLDADGLVPPPVHPVKRSLSPEEGRSLGIGLVVSKQQEKWLKDWEDSMDDEKKKREAAARYTVPFKKSVVRFGGVKLEDLEALEDTDFDSQSAIDTDTDTDIETETQTQTEIRSELEYQHEPNVAEASAPSSSPSFSFSKAYLPVYSTPQGHPIVRDPERGTWGAKATPAARGRGRVKGNTSRKKVSTNAQERKGGEHGSGGGGRKRTLPRGHGLTWRDVRTIQDDP